MGFIVSLQHFEENQRIFCHDCLEIINLEFRACIGTYCVWGRRGWGSGVLVESPIPLSLPIIREKVTTDDYSEWSKSISSPHPPPQAV